MAEQDGADAGRKLKVFVSYSRADIEFADQLVFALEDKGFDPILDRHDIDAAEKWQARLGALIFSSDTIVFVLTETSAASKICQWEVEEAARLGKRMIPVVPRPADGVPPPPALGELNYIHFYSTPAIPGSGFYDGVRRLTRALQVDLDWLRQQTRLSERAAEWRDQSAASRRPEDHLLRATTLAEAEQWLERAPPDATIPALVREYIGASQEAEARRTAEAQAQIAEREAALAEKESAVAARGKADAVARRATFIGGVVAVALSILAIGLTWVGLSATHAASVNRALIFVGETDFRTGEGRPAEAIRIALGGHPSARANWFARLGAGDADYRPIGLTLGSALALNRLLRVYPIDSAESSSVSAVFSPDGARILTYAPAGSASILSIDGEPLGALDWDYGNVSLATVPGEGWRIVVASYEGVHLWDVDSQRVIRRLSDEMADRVSVSADGRRAVVRIDPTDAMDVYDLATGALLQRYEVDGFEAALSGDGSRVLIGGYEGVSLWDVDSNRLLRNFPDSADADAIALSRDGALILIANGREINVWDWAFGASAERSYSIESPVEITRATFLPDGRAMIGGIDGSVILWRLNQHEQSFFASAGSVWSLEVSADGRRALVASQGGPRLLDIDARAPAEFDARDERLSYAVIQGYANAGAVAFSPNGERALYAGSAGYSLYDAESGEVIRTFDGRAGGAYAAAFSLDGRRIAASMSMDRAVEREGRQVVASASDVVVFDAESGQRVQSVSIEGDARTLVFAGDGVWIGATGVVFWSLGSGDLDEPLGKDLVNSIAVSRDRRRLLAATPSGVEVWDPQEQRRLRVLGVDATSVALSSDGERALTLSGQGQVVLWDIETGQVLQVFWTPYERASESVAFSADGRRVLAGAWNRRAFAWDIHPAFFASPSALVRMACDRLRPLGLTSFSEEDRNRFPILSNEPDGSPCPAR